MEPPTTPQQLGRRQIETRKRRRASLPRRMTKWPICTTATRIILPALLAVIVIGSSMTGMMTTTSTTTSTTSLLSVVSAFAPPCHRTPRAKPSIPLSSLGASLAPKPAPAIKNEDCDGVATKQRTNRGRQVGVEVWDAVFSPEVCQELHELAIDHSERTTGEEDEEDDDEENDDDSLDGSSIFVHRGRNRSDADQLTPIEQALDSFLNAYYDHGEDDIDENENREIVVEYWCRQEHLNLEAHADVDEVWFERSCKRMADANGFRYPAIAHVLYLTKPTLGLGPTCVFPPKVSSDHKNSSITEEIESVVTIPAVPGRVLRFPGDALHAVPKPADVWFSQNDGVGDNEEDEDDEEEEGDDAEEEDEDDYEIDGERDDEEWDEEDDDDEERSVILFNTWEASDDDDDDATVSDNDIPTGPIGVPFDPMFHVNSDIDIVDMMMSSVDMDGVEVDKDFVKGMVEYARQQKNQQLKNWREKYCYPETELEETEHDDADAETDEPVVYSKVHCQAKSSWKLAPIDTNTRPTTDPEGHAVGDKGTIRVPLMGDKTRRRYPKRAVLWKVPSSFEKGVKETERPSEFPLTV